MVSVLLATDKTQILMEHYALNEKKTFGSTRSRGPLFQNGHLTFSEPKL